MAQKRKPPRLYLRERKNGAATWVIRHKTRMIATGFGELELAQAQFALAEYAASLDLVPGDGVGRRIMRTEGNVYFVTCDVPDFPIKIGWAMDVAARLQQLQGALPFKVKLLGSMPGYLEDERRLHLTYAADRLQGEWFKRSGELLTFISWHRNRRAA